VGVSGNGTYATSTGFASDIAGTWHWQASYTGDGNNKAAISKCADEPVLVGPASPGLSTAQFLLPNDSATLFGGFNPTGNITFNLFSPSDSTCAGTPAMHQVVTVSGNKTYITTNTTFLASATGEWRWQVTYSGDTSNQGATSACGVENFTITNGS
jgi:hypothetical protein